MHRGVLDEKNYFLRKSQWALAEKRYAYRRLLLTKQMSMSNIDWKTAWSSSLFLSATLAPSAIFLLTLQKKSLGSNRQKFFFTYVQYYSLSFPNHGWILHSEKQSSPSLSPPLPALRRQGHRNFPQISANSSSFRTHDSGYVRYMKTENEMTNNSSMQCRKCGGVSRPPQKSTNLFFRQSGVWVFPEL